MNTIGQALAGMLSALVVGGMVQSCTAQQKAALVHDEQMAAQVAQSAEPWLQKGCQLAEEVGQVIDPSAVGVIVLVCGTAEAADGAVAALTPRMVQVRTERVWSADGDGGVASFYRLRCTLPQTSFSTGQTYVITVVDDAGVHAPGTGAQ